MTYGGTDDYIRNCEQCCKDQGIKYVTFREFLSEEEIGRIRIRTDIFINAQITDAFSGSFCEYLYADTTVFNARWLHYDEIDRYGIELIEFDSFDSLKKEIEAFLQNANKYHIDYDKNEKIIRKLRSIESSKGKWNDIFI